MTLARHFSIFDYEDLSFRKDFGKRLFLLGLRNGEPIIRLSEEDKLTPRRVYYLNLCDEVQIKAGPRTTITLRDRKLKIFLNRLNFEVGKIVGVAVRHSGEGLFRLKRLEIGNGAIGGVRSTKGRGRESPRRTLGEEMDMEGRPALYKPAREVLA